MKTLSPSSLQSLLPVCLMAMLSLAAISSRPLLPIDETRYLSVAWEMHLSGDYLVPHLNGQTYAHKPPLLFWLINAMWMVTGPSTWAARLVTPLAGCLSVFLTGRLARRLWPDNETVQTAAPLVHVTMMLWMIFSPLTMFDALQAVTVQVALAGVLMQQNGAWWRGLALTGLGIGLGVLSKGPVVLIHVLPLLLAAPLLKPGGHARWGRMLIEVAAAVTLGAAIALMWALPAAKSGGAAYGNELLWGQTAGRVVESFSHQQPFWFYLPILPLVVLPWLLFPGWRQGIYCAFKEPAGRFSLTALVLSLVVLSLISGKQPYYLIPSVPLLALLVTRILSVQAGPLRRSQLAWIAGGTILAGLAPVAINRLEVLNFSRLTNACPSAYSVPLTLTGIVLLVPACLSVLSAIRLVSVMAVAYVSVLCLGLGNGFWQEFDVAPLAQEIHQLQEAGIPVAWHTEYHGQVHFTGRLTRPVTELLDDQDFGRWLREHPGGQVVMRAVESVRRWPERSLSGEQRRLALLRQVQSRAGSGAPFVVTEICFDQVLRRGLVTGIMVLARVRPAAAREVSHRVTPVRTAWTPKFATESEPVRSSSKRLM